MKEIAEEFEKQFTCLGENIKKHKTFAVQLKKEVTKIDNNGEEITNNISYGLQFIDNARLMASSLSISKIFLREFVKLNVNMDTIIKNVKLVGLNTKITTALLNTKTFKMM